MPHVLVAGLIHEQGLDVLRQAPGLTFRLVQEVSTESYAPFVGEADAIIIRTQPLPADLIAKAPKLKIVSRHGVGYDNVDVEALSARKIPLTVVGDVNSRAVAEHTLMLMLAAARRTVAHDHAVRSGQWNERNKFDAVELDGKHLLVLGFGRIGRRVAELARAFGMTVSAYDPFLAPEVIVTTGAARAGDLREALATADFVSLHLPASPAGPVIAAKELAAMKPSAILVNAARGELVDETALDLALRQSKLRHAALDVYRQEPPAANDPLVSNSHVTLTPHNAGLTQECAARMAVAAARNVIDCFSGGLDQRLVVNREALGA
jgi:D-3-phosphoglycerate dehydrogenase / 2-oxoglutarate reductase